MHVLNVPRDTTWLSLNPHKITYNSNPPPQSLVVLNVTLVSHFNHFYYRQPLSERSQPSTLQIYFYLIIALRHFLSLQKRQTYYSYLKGFVRNFMKIFGIERVTSYCQSEFSMQKSP